MKFLLLIEINDNSISAALATCNGNSLIKMEKGEAASRISRYIFLCFFCFDSRGSFCCCTMC